MATSANITYRKIYTIGKSKLCWFQTCANGVGRLSGREDMSKTKMALNPVCSLVRNRNDSCIDWESTGDGNLLQFLKDKR